MLNECGSPREEETVRVCSAQIAGIWEDPEKTLDKVESFVRYAAECRADIICFPEQFATGWDPESRNNIQQLTGQIISTLQKYAKKNSIAILGSFREASTKGPKNTALVIGKDGGVLTRYAKMHLFSHGKEDRFFEPGSDLGVFSLGPLTCGIAICYDLRFPELFRIYAKRGVQAIFIPAAWPQNRIQHWELFIRARAAENQMYILGINTTGITPVDRYAGGTMTSDPYGVIIQKAGDSEQLIFTDLDLRVIEDSRRAFPVIRDCKDVLYQELHNANGNKLNKFGK
jgi:predicted amidohydrolase